jgi:transcription elongation factor GreA
MISRKKLPVFQFTQEGFEEIKTEKDEKDKEREKAVVELSEARAMGDLSENGRYKAARANLSRVDSRLRHLRKLIKYGKVVKSHKRGIVGFGSKVLVDIKGKQREFSIVGKEESNPMKGKISNKSPIGRALLSKREGDIVKVEVPAGVVEYKILEVE